MAVVKKITEKVSNKVFEEKCQGKEVCIKSSSCYDKKLHKHINLISTLNVTVDPNVDLTPACQRPLDAYDLAVHNAICTLWERRIREFTTLDLFRIMSGDSHKEFCRNGVGKTKEHLELSLEKISWRKITINFKEENEHYGIAYECYEIIDGERQKVAYHTITGNMVPMVKWNGVLKGGQKCGGWKLTGEPLLYTYAKMKGQIGTLDARHLNIPNSLTDNTIIIREYLLGKILYARGREIKEKTNEVQINFDTLYDYLKLDNSSTGRSQKKRAINTIKNILDFWKNETALLTDYKIVKVKGSTGHMVEGLAIIKINSHNFILKN